MVLAEQRTRRSRPGSPTAGAATRCVRRSCATLRCRIGLQCRRGSSAQTSWRKYQTAATSVPMCSATSNVLLSWGSCGELVPAEELGHQDQVTARRDRQELTESLDDAQDDGVQDGHRSPLLATAEHAMLRGAGFFRRNERERERAVSRGEGQRPGLAGCHQQRDAERVVALGRPTARRRSSSTETRPPRARRARLSSTRRRRSDVVDRR